MIHFIIILTLLFIIPSVHAQEFIPYQNNPIIKKEPTHPHIIQPYVQKDQNLFSIWYADNYGSRYKIVRMQSSNGIDWYDKKDTSVTSRINAHDPSMLFDNNQYTLYFASSNGGNISLWKSTSVDGVTFSPGTETEVLKSQVPWEGTNLSCPSVIKENGLYYLYYSGSGSGNWGIGLATSPDGQTWQRCSNNPQVSFGASEHIVKYNNAYYLFFQTANGLEVQQTDLLNGCNTIWTNRHLINNSMRDPSPIVVGNDLWLYGTLQVGSTYEIGLAANVQIRPPSYPIVIIPGMFASWNGDALLHSTTVTPDAWKINPGVFEYSSILQTLQNKGRVQGADVFMFPYDWRKPVTQVAQDLDSYITQNIWSTQKYQPIQIVGHSLGGVIGRVYVDKNLQKPIKQLITAGSPLLGAVQAYKPLMGGEIERQNSLMWLAEKLILNLNKSQLESDKSTITRMLPILADLIPSFPFLKNGLDQPIMSSLKNSLITSYPIQTNPQIPQLYLGSNGFQTDAGYILGDRTATDTLFDIYSEGHPLSTWKEEGDGSILLKSALNQQVPALQGDHGETIYSTEAIKAILSKLNIPVLDADIPPGKSTAIFPAILAFIQSPAAIQIHRTGTVYSENDGMIHIQQAENGLYQLEVSGTTDGDYVLSVWLIGATDDKWIQFKKATHQGKKDVYVVSFDGAAGGEAYEYVEPSPMPTPTAIPTMIPTLVPTIVPTVRPTAIPTSKPRVSPTCKPSPTKIPSPTKKPTPTPVLPKPNPEKQRELLRIILELLRKLFQNRRPFWAPSQ